MVEGRGDGLKWYNKGVWCHRRGVSHVRMSQVGVILLHPGESLPVNHPPINAYPYPNIS